MDKENREKYKIMFSNLKAKERIGIIGHFGGKEIFLDGQTVKTKILYDELYKKTDWKIQKVDTYYKNKKPVRLLIDTVKCLLQNRNIIVLLSGNGMKFYFPILSFASRCFGTKIYHDVIGGNLDSYIDRYPKFQKYLSSFKVNWVETEGLKKRLEAKGISNCRVLPNFKRLNIVTDTKKSYTAPFRFCFFARVMREKGVEAAIEAIQSINVENGSKICELDIYGCIDADYREHFDSIMKSSSDAISYKGMVPFEKSSEVLKDYYALLFPTFWNGEGFPGTIVDAFSASIPVIATDWNCNSEIIDDGLNGIIYPNRNIKTLKEAVLRLISNSGLMSQMKQNCSEKAKQYQPDRYIDKIITTVKEG